MTKQLQPDLPLENKTLALVTGGTGAVGPALVRRLVEAGYRVRVLARHHPAPDLLPAGVEVCRGDITDPQAVGLAMADVAVVFHLAAKLHITNPTPDLRATYERVNLMGTQTLLAAARAAAVRRFVFFSTISVYGPSAGNGPFSEGALTEASPLRPQTMYAQTKAEAEALVLAARQADTGTPLGVVLRLAAVYGPRIKGNYASLVKALRRGWFVPVGPGSNRRSLIHVQDVASAAILAARDRRAAGQVYNVTDGETPTFAEIVNAICQGLGQAPPRWHAPVGPIRLALGLVEQSFAWLGRTPPLGRFTLDKLLEDVAVSGQKIQNELGFQPQFRLRQGWATTTPQLEYE